MVGLESSLEYLPSLEKSSDSLFTSLDDFDLVMGGLAGFATSSASLDRRLAPSAGGDEPLLPPPAALRRVEGDGSDGSRLRKRCRGDWRLAEGDGSCSGCGLAAA